MRLQTEDYRLRTAKNHQHELLTFLRAYSLKSWVCPDFYFLLPDGSQGCPNFRFVEIDKDWACRLSR